ncbi:hypothetical protein [Streptomyces mesophilus]|uniref:hypothetical protein n=1 Tax=Streptomyces mesophilus TaxID=1775132 RepID=UPI003323DDB0
MQRTAVDGVTVLWADAPGPLRAALTFGCGVRDETFRSFGVTHMVEHLAMGTLPRLHFEHNAMVGLEETAFLAAGRPEQIAMFLGAVCGALSDLPLERMEREAGVLAAEGTSPVPLPMAAVLNQRYGNAGYGLAPLAGPGYDRLDSAAVRAHCAAHFTRSNAVLQLTGPVPEGLRLPLPDGPPATAAPCRVVRHGPGYDFAPIEGAALGLALPYDAPAATLGHALLEHRLTERARRERGLSYSVQYEIVQRDSTTLDAVIWLDSRPEQDQVVAELLWDEALRLAREEPGSAELKEEIEGFREAGARFGAVEEELSRAATAELNGVLYRPAQERLDRLQSVTPAEVTAVFADAVRSALLAVAQGTEPRLRTPDGVALPRAGSADPAGDLPDGRVFRPPLVARAIWPGARRARLVLTADSIGMRDPGGDVQVIPFREVVGMEKRGEARVVFGADGAAIAVLPDQFGSGAGTVAKVLDEKAAGPLVFERSALHPADEDD